MNARSVPLHASTAAALRGLLAVSILFAPAAVATSQTGAWTAGTGVPDYVYFQSFALDPRNPSRIWAGGINGREGHPGLFRSDDEGVSWRVIEGANAPVEVETIAVDPQNSDTIFAGSRRSDDGGLHWTTLPVPVSDNGWFGYGPVNALAFDPHSHERLWAATSAGLSRSDDSGRSWTETAPLTKEIYQILFDHRRPGTMYASSYDRSYLVDSPYYPEPYTTRAGGPIYSSTDGGESFRRAADFGTPILSFALDPFEDGVIYAGSLRAFHRSRNYGATWETVSEGPADSWIFAIAPDPVRRGRLYAATSYGVSRSVNGGRSWHPFGPGLPAGEVHALVISPDGRRLHAGSNSGGVFWIDLESEPRSSICVPDATRLCLIDGRYSLDLMAARRGESANSPGSARLVTDRAGYFGLPALTGDPDLPEVVVKMLPEGTFGKSGAPAFHSSLTSASYVLTVTDTFTGDVATYGNRAEDPYCGGANVAFLPVPPLPGLDVAGPKARVRHASAGANARGPALELLGGRFSVTLSAFSSRHHRNEPGVAVARTDRYGFFSLPGFTGDESFPEVYVKMIDFTSVSGNYLFFHAGLTSLDYTLTLEDTATGAVRIYENAQPFCGDADAFDRLSSIAIPTDLSGGWWGFVTFPSDCYSDCDPFEEVRVTLSQSGSAVTGELSTACLGTIPLRGTLDGTRLMFDLANVLGIADFEGGGTPHQIHVEANCDPWGYGFDHTMTLELDRTP